MSIKAVWANKKALTNSGNSGIIKSAKTNIEVQDVHYIGKINKNILEKEFGKINTSEVILTDERRLHIQERHPDDYAIFEKYSNAIITNPDIMLKDSKNKNTVFAIKHIDDTNLNVIVKLSIGDDAKHPKNSIMSAYRIRDKNVVKLIKKNKILDKSE